MTRRTRAALATGIAVAVTLSLGGTTLAYGQHPGIGPQSPPIARSAPFTPTVKYLLTQMTVDEKLTLVHGAIGAGIFGPATVPTDPTPNGAIGVVQGIPRLGVPVFREVDSNGVNAFADSTAYPGRLGLAATFDRSAVTQFGQAAGTEGRALGMDLIYGPQVDLTRFPTWIRNMTTYGEDPYLTSQLTAADVNAIQSTGLLSQVKHYGFYNGQAQAIPSKIDERTAHEIYLKPYEAAVKDGDVSSLMCSYAIYQITDVEAQPDYSCSNSYGLNGILRDQGGFKGWVGSDYGGSHATSDLLAGLDREFLTNNLAPAALKPLVDPTSATYDPAYASALDTANARVLYQYQRFGLLDDSNYPAGAKTGVRPARPAPATVDEQAGIRLARTLAEQSGVLLKNDGQTLPLSRDKGSTIAVLGPTADLLPAAPNGERSRGFGQRSNISPLDVLKQNDGRATISYSPGIDRIGTTVPGGTMQTTNPGSTAGLTRTVTDPAGKVLSTGVDTQLSGNQTDLVKGNTYTWSGYLTVPSADTYTLWLQRPTGTVVGDPSGPNKGVNPGLQAGPITGINDTVTLNIDGAAQTLDRVSTVLQNTYPGGPTVNGQYLGLNSTGSAVQLTAGPHHITMSYTPAANAASAPTFRLAWAAQQHDLDAAVAAAKQAKTAVVFVDDANTTTTAGDVGTLGANQDALIEQVAAVNPNTVVVLNTNGAVQMPWLGNVKSVLEMWYPGQEGGTATANLLYGKANPSGKLPITFPVDSNSTPFAGHPERSVGVNGEIVWSEGLQVGYRWYLANNVNPLFPFGYGLSYTSFTYDNLHVTSHTNGKNGQVRVSFRVRNTGKVPGSEAPQVYLTLPSDAGEPAKRLVNFDRVDLAPGRSTTVSLVIDPTGTERPLSIWDTGTHAWRTLSGTYTVSVGPSALATSLTDHFEVR
jgi:beta-glucosidase